MCNNIGCRNHENDNFLGNFQPKWMKSLDKAPKTASNEVQHAIFLFFIRLEIIIFMFRGWYLHLILLHTLYLLQMPLAVTQRFFICFQNMYFFLEILWFFHFFTILSFFNRFLAVFRLILVFLKRFYVVIRQNTTYICRKKNAG